MSHLVSNVDVGSPDPPAHPLLPLQAGGFVNHMTGMFCLLCAFSWLSVWIWLYLFSQWFIRWEYLSLWSNHLRARWFFEKENKKNQDEIVATFGV